jgi:hypothetical protein
MNELLTNYKILILLFIFLNPYLDHLRLDLLLKSLSNKKISQIVRFKRLSLRKKVLKIIKSLFLFVG